MEFKELVEEFDRMCAFYDENPEQCPLFKETVSNEWDEWWIYAEYEPEKFQEIVEKWSKENPKPIYPTILELLHYIALKSYPEWRDLPLNELVNKRLPDNVAKEWGIVPINECGLTKYCEESEWR